MASLLKSRRAWAVTLALAFVATPPLVLYLWLNPADRVVVTVSNIDPSTRLLCLIAEPPDGPEAMWWSLDKVGPFSMHPSRGVSDYNPEWDRGTVMKRVLWREGSRYGVLTRDEDDVWRVFWFGPEDVHLKGKNWVVRSGRAEIRLPKKGHAEPASMELLDFLGFDSEVRKLWRELGGR